MGLLNLLPVVQQPDVHTAGVEEVETGQPPDLDPRGEVRETDDAVGALGGLGGAQRWRQ